MGYSSLMQQGIFSLQTPGASVSGGKVLVSYSIIIKPELLVPKLVNSALSLISEGSTMPVIKF
jgi:hypothetical protein